MVKYASKPKRECGGGLLGGCLINHSHFRVKSENEMLLVLQNQAKNTKI